MIVAVSTFLALAIPLMPLYDWISPWDEAVAAFEENEISGIRVMVGFGGGRKTTISGGEVFTESRHSRVFLVVPSVFKDRNIYQISQSAGGLVRFHTQENTAYVYLIMWLIIGLFFRYFSLPRIVQPFIQVGKVETTTTE